MFIEYRKQILFSTIVMFVLFAFTGYRGEKKIQLLSDKIIELEKNNEELNSQIYESKKSNEKLDSEKSELKISIEMLNSKIEDLKLNNTQLKESNDALQKENVELKKKLEAAAAYKQTANTVADKTAYLTFDDGPSNNTIKILNILKENNIKATFFVNGHAEEKETYQRIVNEGHVIGNHTFTHNYSLLYKTIDGFIADKQRLDDFIYEVAGVKPEILRFPGGSNNQVSYSYGGADFMDKLTRYIKQANIKYFDWNVDSSDAAVTTQDKDKIVSEVLKGAKNKKQAIILMHDSNPKTTTALALPSIIKGLQEQGFKFSTLSTDSNAVQFK